MTDAQSKASLADAVAWLTACETLPPEIEAKARLLMLDTLGCLIAAQREPGPA